MKFAIVGAGNTGHAISAYLADKNAGCVLYTRSEAKAAVIQENGIISEYCHKEPYRLQTHISIAFPDAPQKKYLKVSPNEPILVWYTAVIDAADMVLGYTETFARPEDFKPYINFML